MVDCEKIAQMNVVALAGGVGGAKLAVGLQEVVAPGRLTVIGNTADDFEHWGLSICPDLDTVMYNLAGVNNPETGWGRLNETFQALDAMSQIGGEEWFMLGDQDLAVHLRRSEWRRQGLSLTEITERLRRSFGIPTTILPMSNAPVQTLVHTDEGDLPFQHYFVRLQCEPMVLDLTFVGSDKSRLTSAVVEAVEEADVIVFCPSNPYLSIDPILSIRGMRELLLRTRVPRIAVSPIVGGEAVKGPAAKLMRELGKTVSPRTIVDHYGALITGFVMDDKDADMEHVIDVPTLITNTLMNSLEIKRNLAESVLSFAIDLNGFSSEFTQTSEFSQNKLNYPMVFHETLDSDSG